MKIGKFILIIITLTYQINLFGSCSGEYFSITELLNHDPNNHHIFTCQILETYVSGHSYESIAVVKRRFVGNPNDTIFIKTGGFTTAGGQKLFPKSEWLIFSRSSDSLHYWATVCDYLSAKLVKGNNELCQRDISSLGKTYLEVLEKYDSIKKNRFSGYKEINGEGQLIAKGNFKLGVPTADWIHYSQWNRFEEKIKRSEIAYKDGMLHGKYNLYREKKDQNIIIERRIYELDKPILIESDDRYQKKYEYRNDRERFMISTKFDSSGIILKQYAWVELDYTNKHQRIKYKHGFYLNKVSRDSSEYSPLAEGNYFKGARIGEWKLFNKKGELVETKMYPEKSDDDPKFQIYDEKGNVRLSGFYIDGKRIGVWKKFYDNKLEYEELYNSNGNKISKTNHYTSGGMELTFYLNNLKHGQKIIFNEDKTTRSIEHFERGKLEGKSIFFNNDGTIKKESTYINSREFTSNQNSSYFSNGFLNGYFIQYHHKTKKKIREGAYWNGYKTGVWIHYYNNGTYSKKYYLTDKEELMNQCENGMEKLTEQFDKDGNLINSWKF